MNEIEIHERVTAYQVSCLPLDGTAVRGWAGVFDVTVEWSGIGDRWAVRWQGRVYDADGVEMYEPIPSSRDDEFLARFRHDLPTALAVARKIAPSLQINGTYAAIAAIKIVEPR